MQAMFEHPTAYLPNPCFLSTKRGSEPQNGHGNNSGIVVTVLSLPTIYHEVYFLLKSLQQPYRRLLEYYQLLESDLEAAPVL